MTARPKTAHSTTDSRLTTFAGVIALLLATAMLTSCGTARVVRGPGVRHPMSSPVRVSAPRYGETAVVQRGETLYHIATGHGISALDLAMWNEVPPPYTIHPGQRLRLYPADRVVPRSSGNVVPLRPVASAVRPASRASVVATPAPPPVAAPSASPFTWLWPAEGALAGRYVPGEPTQQGIDIAGQAGQPVRAAADGVVVYSGSGLVGYGELVIVKHNDAWLSAYGHNRARKVNEGQIVKAGQQIAEMGHSGAARDMLHFEIRYNGKPVDPLQYLPRHN